MAEITGKLQDLLVTLPMMVSIFWALVIALDLWRDGNRAAHRQLLGWMVVTAALYTCHTVFFTRNIPWIPLSDTLYVSLNLAVYPVFLYYILTLTRGEVSTRMKAAQLLPPPFLESP